MSSSSSAQVEGAAELFDQLQQEVFERIEDDPEEEDVHILAKHEAAMHLLQGLQDLSTAYTNRIDEQRAKDENTSIPKPWKNRIQGLKEPRRGSLEFDSSVLDTAGEVSDREYRKAQAERNTWDLLEKVIPIRRPKPQNNGLDLNSSIQLYLEVRGVAHQYTPESELWERFLLSDANAREKKAVLDWLETCARRGDGEIDDIVQQLEESTGTKGVWNRGSLNTRERIKAEKRKRGLDSVLATTTLRTSENTEPLITQLDPDAVTRSSRALEKSDDYRDRAIWLACYAMLRQGRSWDEIREWCEERGEGWRAASFGMAVDKQESRTGLGGPQAGLLWRQMCLAGARHTGLDLYQRAVYGILAGDIKSVDPACRSFDDLLHARYNALLIRSFEGFLQRAFPDRFSAVMAQKFPALTSTLSEEELEMDPADYIFKVTSNPAASNDSNDPMKVLQASIIADDFQRLITHLGIILAHRANQDSESRMLPPLENYTYSKRYECLADDWDVIRIVVHIFAIYEYVGYEFPDPYRYEIIEYVIIAYIDYLRSQRKIEAIPTYANLLTDERKYRTLGIMLVGIEHPDEQQLLMELIEQQGVNSAKVVTEQYLFAASLMGFLDNSWKPISRFELVERTGDSRWPGYRIRRDFSPGEMKPDEQKLARSVEWYAYVNARWKETFYGLSYAMRVFLLSGMFNGALHVTKEVPYKGMSQTKTPLLIGSAVDVFDTNAGAREQSPPQLRRSTRQTSKQLDDNVPKILEPLTEEEQFNLDMLRSQCRQYCEMQQLCLALEHLSYFKDWEETMTKAPKYVISLPKFMCSRLILIDSTLEMRNELKVILKDLTEAIQPLLSSFMTLIPNEEDLSYYTAIRQLYLPPVILAYASARVFAAQFLGPDTLLPALELANVVASEENKELANDFVKTGLMKDFVRCLAMASKVLVRLNQEKELAGMDDAGKKRKAKKEKKSRLWEGETIEIWDPTKIL
jgi:nuclear pore complex protein Nup107